MLNSRLTADISECMELGLKNLMKNYSQEDKVIPVSLPKTKIRKLIPSKIRIMIFNYALIN